MVSGDGTEWVELERTPVFASWADDHLDMIRTVIDLDFDGVVAECVHQLGVFQDHVREVRNVVINGRSAQPPTKEG